MDKIDVLGSRPDRHPAFTKELLSESSDAELQQIVKQAAEELSSPMAIVSLVLDRIQFFKASYGLPESLSSSKGTHRDASFCQFVVKDEKPFEVNNAPEDMRVPQQVVKDYKIKSYLGVPISVDDIVIGSLCVLDTERRQFSEKDKKGLTELSKKVNARLESITKNRRKTRLKLTESAIKPGLEEIREILLPLQSNINAGYSSIAALRTFLIMTKSIFTEDAKFSDTYKSSFEAAMKANEDSEALLSEIEIISEDLREGVNAINRLVEKSDALPLSKILVHSQDLSRNSTKAVGGFRLPDLQNDPVIYPNGMLATAIISNCLISIAEELKEKESVVGIKMKVKEEVSRTRLYLSTSGLKQNEIKKIAKKMGQALLKDPSVSIAFEAESLVLNFISAQS